MQTPIPSPEFDGPLTGISRRGFISASALAALGLTAYEISSLTASASAIGGYTRPCGDVRITDSWQGHKNRTPPSREPGTDYGVGVGTPVVAAESGRVDDLKVTNTEATGRFVSIQLDDGNYVRYLHLSSVAVAKGARVTRGQVIAASGASGLGSDNGYGAHVHVSLWQAGTPWTRGFANTVDFERFVGTATPPAPAPTPTNPWEINMAIQLWLYTPTNSLMLIDHMNMTIRDLGNVSTLERDHFAAGGAYRTIGEPQWTYAFEDFAYIKAPNVTGQPAA